MARGGYRAKMFFNSFQDNCRSNFGDGRELQISLQSPLKMKVLAGEESTVIIPYKIIERLAHYKFSVVNSVVTAFNLPCSLMGFTAVIWLMLSLWSSTLFAYCQSLPLAFVSPITILMSPPRSLFLTVTKSLLVRDSTLLICCLSLAGLLSICLKNMKAASRMQ